MKRYWLVVAAGFAFSIISTVVAFFVKAVHAPLEVSYICGQLVWPGMAITARWLVPDVIGHPLAALSLIVALNALIYCGLLWLLLELLRFILGRRNSQS